MTRILGIDPGSRRTGFGFIEVVGSKLSYVTSGIIRLPEQSLPERLKVIANSVRELVVEHQPSSMAVEEVFFARDPRAALRLGQARGAAIVAGVQADLPVAEYSARTVKQAVVGSGAATKEQVQHMVTRLLALPAPPAEDAADALAVAICHAHSLTTHANLRQTSRYARGRRK
ncbi:MAG TPA: crossover junction endodeoxyribonuclease RuvC [Porticoccaceae bacterium]|nr:crossover junction endodeoxyribonuclease RuvC [Porticoccaceae bacterium]